MRNDWKLASMVLAGVMIIGCDTKKDETTVTTPMNTAPADPQPNPVANTVNNATAAVKDAATNAQGQVSTATDAAQTKLKQVGEYIAQKKFDLADTALKEVEGMKASLPEMLQTQVTAMRTQLDAAKAASGTGITMPTMPGASH